MLEMFKPVGLCLGMFRILGLWLRSLGLCFWFRALGQEEYSNGHLVFTRDPGSLFGHLCSEGPGSIYHSARATQQPTLPTATLASKNDIIRQGCSRLLVAGCSSLYIFRIIFLCLHCNFYQKLICEELSQFDKPPNLCSAWTSGEGAICVQPCWHGATSSKTAISDIEKCKVPKAHSQNLGRP